MPIDHMTCTRGQMCVTSTKRSFVLHTYSVISLNAGGGGLACTSEKNGMQLEAITYQLANCCCSYSKYGGSCSLALQIVLQTHVILILFFLCFGTSEYNRGSAVSRPDKNLCNLCTIKPIPQFFGGWFCIKIVISWTNLQVREFL